MTAHTQHCLKLCNQLFKKVQNSILLLKHCHVFVVTNTWNSGSKLFWSLLYTSNSMCYMHCMIVLAMLSWTNGQYKAKFANCAVLDNVVYVCSPILRISWQALLSLTIPIEYDVLHPLHDGIGDCIPSK